MHPSFRLPEALRPASPAALACVLLTLAACGGPGGSLALRGADTAPNPEGMPMTRAVPSPLVQGVQQHTLPNGLTVLIKADPAAPAVAIVTHVKAGYFHEPDELVGISHVIEHMFFNGTPNRPDPEAISRETKAVGGSLNAGTIYDRTSYYVVLPRERWKEGLAVQADALQNPLFDEDVLEREMRAIKQEARRKLDNPIAYGREKLFELAFDEHRIRRWRIGTEEQLDELTREDLVRFFEDHYRPSNIVLTVVGGVDAEEALAEITRLYGDMERGHLRKNGGPNEPDQENFRYDRLRGEVERGYTFLGFHTPGEGHPDNAALEVLATILATGRSSRMQANLKEELGIVSTVAANSYQYEDVGFFEISATHDLERTEWVSREFFVEIERIKIMPPTDEEIARAQGIIEAAEAFGQEEVLGQAQLLAAYEAHGDFRDHDRDLNRLRAVTAEDVQRVAKEYLTFDNASLLEYVTWQVLGERTPEEQLAHLKGAVMARVATMDEAGLPVGGPSLMPRETIAAYQDSLTAGSIEAGTRQRFDLPGGGVLVVEENPSAPTVSAGIYFFGGRTMEHDNISGVTQMMQRVMVKQTRTRDVDELAAEIESMGTQIQRIGTDDYFGFAVGSRAEDFAAAFDVLFDVVSRPRFDDEQYRRELKFHEAAMRALEDQSGAKAVQMLRLALYNQHPYGLPELGQTRVIRYLDADRLDLHHFDVVRPETMFISVAGRVDADAVFDMVSAYRRTWRTEGEPAPSDYESFYGPENVEQLPSLLSTRERKVQKEKAQTALVLAFPTVDRRHPDVPVLEVLSAITGGMGGTFFEEIRGQRGLAYQVATFNAPKALGGFFGTFVACSPEEADTVRELVLALHARLATAPPDAETIRRAQNYLIGAREVNGQTNTARSGRLAAAVLSGRPLEFLDTYEERIRSVTREDIARVAQEYFVDQEYAVGIVEGTAGRGADPEDSR